MPDIKAKSEEQKVAEAEVEDFREDLGPFVVAAETTRMPMVFTDAKAPDNPIIFANDNRTGARSGIALGPHPSREGRHQHGLGLPPRGSHGFPSGPLRTRPTSPSCSGAWCARPWRDVFPAMTA
jgi:hypothetical protein